MTDKTQAIRATQIITFAMIMGLTIFLAFTLVTNKFGIDGEANSLCYIGLGFALVTVPLHWFVPSFFNNPSIQGDWATGDHEDDELFSRLYPVFQTRHIVACALLEGAGFFNIFCYMQTKYVLSLTVACALILLIAIRFPTRPAVESWIQRQIEAAKLR